MLNVMEVLIVHTVICTGVYKTVECVVQFLPQSNHKLILKCSFEYVIVALGLTGTQGCIWENLQLKNV